MLNPVRLIEAKRDGRTLEPSELRALFEGYLSGSVEEYQMAAFLMAVQFRGMTADELAEFVRLMLHSGAVLDLASVGAVRIDKHSTGGVGDKVSLPLAVLVAEAGVPVPMMSGRGLGHTGGTLDKLESIPGFRTDLSLDEFRAVLGRVGTAMIGQTEEIAPLDRRLYALRSVTGTVPSIPLIAASIMSKKLAEDLTGLVLDVKVGSGAFMEDEDRALELSRTMVRIGGDHGVPTVALLTAMDRTLGGSAGNALEVAEAIACLQGSGPTDLRDVVVALAGEMVVLGGVAADVEEGRRWAAETLASGSALERFRTLIEAQGGDPGVIDDPGRLPTAPVVEDVRALEGGTLRRIEPRRIGEVVVELGGGRFRLGAEIHPGVGVDRIAPPGQAIDTGDRIARVHARSHVEARTAVEAIRAAVEMETGEPVRPLLSHRVTEGGVQTLQR
ncbi:MAG: thymidine phosphorylase [Gemmatimonadales bacterium]|nr:MAG: thymidine phosphorylase [Gemmatimonadales bacterium]